MTNANERSYVVIIMTDGIARVIGPFDTRGEAADCMQDALASDITADEANIAVLHRTW